MPAAVAKRATVAIVMANHNHARFLPESLEGIFAQTRPADEVVIVDDGSTDGSMALLAERAQRHPSLRLLHQEQRGGALAAISRALAISSADYFVWTAADDRLLPAFLEKSMAVLERHPQACLCFSETAELRPGGEVCRFAVEPTVSHTFRLDLFPEFMTPRDIARRLGSDYLPIAANTVIVRRDAWQAAGGFLPQLEWHADYFAYFTVAARHGACVIPETLALIRANPGSYSSAMHDPARQRPVLTAMLDLLGKPDYRDARALFRHGAAFSPWHTLMLRLLLRRPQDWDLLIPYSLWKLREYKRGHALSWPQTMAHMTKRLAQGIARIAGARLFRFGSGRDPRQLAAERDRFANSNAALLAERDRLASENGALAAERDGLAQANGTLSAERDHLSLTRDSLTGERNALAGDAASARALHADAERRVAQSEIERAAERAALQGDLQRTAAELEDVRRHAVQLQGVQSAYQSIKAISDAELGERGRGKAIEAATRHAAEIGATKLPPMLFTTMPKSGTYYIAKLFGDGLFIDSRIVSHQYFPDDVIQQPALAELARGNCVSQDHFAPSRINLTHIARHVDRMIVHLRDPRQAMLSYVHYLDSERFRRHEADTLLFVYPPMPQDFYRIDLRARLDWAIEHWLPLLIEWTQGWVDASARQGAPRIKFTRFEDMVADHGKFVAEVLEFFEVPPARFHEPNIAQDPEVHFRKGETDEWRRALTPAQAAAASAQIPAALARRFGWDEK